MSDKEKMERATKELLEKFFVPFALEFIKYRMEAEKPIRDWYETIEKMSQEKV